MENNPLISIVIPAYNREATIERAIRSVLNQSYQNIEVVVIDDCSTDSTLEVAKSVLDERLHIYKLDANSGACVARNYGVDHSQGQMVAFQDSDDFWHEDKLSKQLDYLKKYDYEFVSCGFNKINGLETREMGLMECSSNKMELWCQLLNHNWISTQTILCYRYCFDKIRFDPKVRRFQDWDLGLQAARFYRVGSLNETLVDVYEQENSITNIVKEEEAKNYIVEKQESFIDFNNRIMAAQFYKTKADISRRKQPIYASKFYWKCFKIKPSLKIFCCYLLSRTGLITLYEPKI